MDFTQYIVYQVVDSSSRPGKTDKFPIDPITLNKINAHDSRNWLPRHIAEERAAKLGNGYGVGFVFTEQDPLWFLDLDDCLMADGTWSPLACELVSKLDGAYVEVSLSGRGLHIIGSGQVP